MIITDSSVIMTLSCRTFIVNQPQNNINNGVSPRLTCHRTQTLNAVTLVVTTSMNSTKTMMPNLMILLVMSYFLMQPVHSHN